MLPYTRDYIQQALAATPDVLESLLTRLAPASPIWDFRPDPERLTLREVTCHLYAWEGIFNERIERMLAEDEPEFEHFSESALAGRYGYAASGPAANVAGFRERRAALLARLQPLDGAAWLRRCRRPMGEMPLDEQAALILAHDGYHLRQTAQWLALADGLTARDE